MSVNNALPGALYFSHVRSREEPIHTILLLTISNIFMTIAWYRHFKNKDSPLWAGTARERWGCMTWRNRVTGTYRLPALARERVERIVQ
jgi:hypothetical protein